MWIEALCINQGDIADRSSQVQQTGQVYSKTSALTIWLGPGDEHEEKAVRMIKTQTNE
jgi:hypothetical protein